MLLEPHAGLVRDRHADRFHDYENQTLALIAHDAMKPTMLDFAARNFELLSRYRRRVGTGTTGQKLNEMAWSKGWPADKPWVDRYNSGPLGGDAQIADLVLEKRCWRQDVRDVGLESTEQRWRHFRPRSSVRGAHQLRAHRLRSG